MNDFLHPAFLIRLAIAIAYIALAAVLFFLPVTKLPILSDKTKLALSVLLFAYGLFRLYRAFKFKKEME
ncbi:MAG TPA: hypothetical protein PKO18_01680 [Chitinophagales bacterium]|nr:hypothetical protein [Chitinophagales bacterium]HNL83915.1 hypothetical protein [Chitinophagales bacterium]